MADGYFTQSEEMIPDLILCCALNLGIGVNEVEVIEEDHDGAHVFVARRKHPATIDGRNGKDGEE